MSVFDNITNIPKEMEYKKNRDEFVYSNDIVPLWKGMEIQNHNWENFAKDKRFWFKEVSRYANIYKIYKVGFIKLADKPDATDDEELQQVLPKWTQDFSDKYDFHVTMMDTGMLSYYEKNRLTDLAKLVYPWIFEETDPDIVEKGYVALSIMNNIATEDDKKSLRTFARLTESYSENVFPLTAEEMEKFVQEYISMR